MIPPMYKPKTTTPWIVVRGDDAGTITTQAEIIARGQVGWPCDGRNYNPGEYRQLGAAIGDAHGYKDGRPCVPDLRGNQHSQVRG